jgi:hypothetical protein
MPYFVVFSLHLGKKVNKMVDKIKVGTEVVMCVDWIEES